MGNGLIYVVHGEDDPVSCTAVDSVSELSLVRIKSRLVLGFVLSAIIVNRLAYRVARGPLSNVRPQEPYPSFGMYDCFILPSIYLPGTTQMRAGARFPSFPRADPTSLKLNQTRRGGRPL